MESIVEYANSVGYLSGLSKLYQHLIEGYTGLLQSKIKEIKVRKLKQDDIIKIREYSTQIIECNEELVNVMKRLEIAKERKKNETI